MTIIKMIMKNITITIPLALPNDHYQWAQEVRRDGQTETANQLSSTYALQQALIIWWGQYTPQLHHTNATVDAFLQASMYTYPGSRNEMPN